MPCYRHLLFDLDGTLTDPALGITSCIQHALAQMSLPIPLGTDLHWCIGPPLLKSFEKILGEAEKHRAAEALDYYRERFSTVGLYENEVYTKIPYLLEQLKNTDYILFVATSKPQIFAKQILEHFKIAHHFQNIYGSKLNGQYADKADLITYIMTTEGLATENALMIGDREFDVLGATANHVNCLGVSWGYGSKIELQDAGAIAIINEPLELLAWLQNQ